MTNTTNYNLILAEGTDLVNYLTQTNPNFSDLDTIIKGISDATVTTATEVASGTAHAITRTLPDANVIRFTATSNWVLGDTMTIDGTPVTVVKPNGTNLQSGDYVIGAEVLGVLRATQFTVYLGAPSSLDAADITYDNTGSGLTATDVQNAIDEVNSNLSPNTWTHISPTELTLSAVGNISETYSQVINAKRIIMQGSFTTQIDIINITGTAEKGYSYHPSASAYTADGVVSVNFNTGLVTLQCGTFPTYSGAAVTITDMWILS